MPPGQSWTFLDDVVRRPSLFGAVTSLATSSVVLGHSNKSVVPCLSRSTGTTSTHLGAFVVGTHRVKGPFHEDLIDHVFDGLPRSPHEWVDLSRVRG